MEQILKTIEILTLKAFFLSLANSSKDEIVEEYRFGKRFLPIVEYLKIKRDQNELDLLVMSEGRPFKNFDGTKVITVHEMVSVFAKELDMHPVYLPNHGQDDKSFVKIVLFDPKKLFLLETRGVWPSMNANYSPYPSGYQFCQSMFVLKFFLNTSEACSGKEGSYVNSKERIFELVVIHNPVSKIGRELYFNSMIKTFSNNKVARILMGDFNLLPDLGGIEQEEELDKHFINHTKDIGTTFIGFPHDCNPETKKPWESSLDRVFTNNFLNSTISVSTEPINDSQGNRLSDHHGLSTRIDFELS